MPTILITGTSRGLGLEFVRQYAASGWTILACARQPSGSTELMTVAAANPQRVRLLALDVEDHAAIERTAHELEGTPIDVLLNSAGIMGNGSFATEGIAFGRFGQSDFADWERVFRVNVIAPMKMAEAFVGHVASSDQKKIVTLTSMLGSVALNRVGWWDRPVPLATAIHWNSCRPTRQSHRQVPALSTPRRWADQPAAWLGSTSVAT